MGESALQSEESEVEEKGKDNIKEREAQSEHVTASEETPRPRWSWSIAPAAASRRRVFGLACSSERDGLEKVEEREREVGAHRMRQAWSRTCGDSREARPEALSARFSYGFMALILQDRFGFDDAMRYGSLKGGKRYVNDVSRRHRMAVLSR